jgi:hypothetical protein
MGMPKLFVINSFVSSELHESTFHSWLDVAFRRPDHVMSVRRLYPSNGDVGVASASVI